jgi:hypothetical protein
MGVMGMDALVDQARLPHPSFPDERHYLAVSSAGMRIGCRLVTADRKLFNALQDSRYAAYLCWVANLL